MTKIDYEVIFPKSSKKKGFGVELEFAISEENIQKYHRNKTDPRLHILNKFRQNDYCEIKEDGSCGGEITLGIFDFSVQGILNFMKIMKAIYHDMKIIRRDLEQPLRKICYKRKQTLMAYANCEFEDEDLQDWYNIDENGHIELLNLNCGFHVHLSESLFPDEISIERFFSLFGSFQKDIFRYCVHSTRKNNEYAMSLHNVFRSQSAERYSINEIRNLEHHHCMNLSQNYDTIEIRHGGMTSNLQSIKNWMILIWRMYNISLLDDAFLNTMKKKSIRGLFLEGSQILNWINSTSSDKFSYDFK
jgi:hypothetical protein